MVSLVFMVGLYGKNDCHLQGKGRGRVGPDPVLGPDPVQTCCSGFTSLPTRCSRNCISKTIFAPRQPTVDMSCESVTRNILKSTVCKFILPVIITGYLFDILSGKNQHKIAKRRIFVAKSYLQNNFQNTNQLTKVTPA